MTLMTDWSGRAALALGMTLAAATSGRAAPYLLRDLRPYAEDEATALLLHLDGSLEDASGARRALEARGVRWSADGVLGGALACDGAQEILVPYQGEFRNGFTVEAWVWTPRPTTRGTEKRRLLSWGETLDISVIAARDNMPRLAVSMATDQGRYAFAAHIPLSYRRWTHVAVRYDPASPGTTFMVLINGTHTDHGRFHHHWPGSAYPEVHGRLLQSAAPLVIAKGFRGLLDELRISSRPRSGEELAGRWPSGRIGDHEPFVPDVTAGTPPGWESMALWISAVEAVPTFNSMGVYARYVGDTNGDGVCRIRYRKKGEEGWREGMDLEPCRMDGEFRGSLLQLDSDTLYEIELTAVDPDSREADVRFPPKPGDRAAPVRLEKRTWPDDVPIGKAHRLPAGATAGPLVIDARGAPDAWVLYAPPDDAEAVVTVEGTDAAEAVRFDGAEYVVLERVTVRGGKQQGILAFDSHHVRIRRCEITGFGEQGIRAEDGRFVDPRTKSLIGGRAGVRIGLQSSQVVAEDNLIHSPRGTSWPWKFGHPGGPVGFLLGFAPNNVIRRNEVVGSEAHWWDDAIASENNPAFCGGPYRDADISENLLLCIQDDGTELDGGQCNVRFWGNRIESWYNGVSLTPPRKGPSYVFRNLFVNGGDEGCLSESPFKVHGTHSDRARTICIHNTHVSSTAQCRPEGVYTRASWGEDIVTATFLNNLNIARGGYVDATAEPFRYPYRGLPIMRAPQEGDYRLAASSPAIDAGIAAPNVSDAFAGKAPDLGALESTPDQDGVAPRRPSGMAVAPKHVRLKHTLGCSGALETRGEGEKATVMLTIPPSAGRRWTAIANCPWLRCTPASGLTSGQPLPVTIDAFGAGLGVRPHRGAMVFRTDMGYNVSLLVDVRFLPAKPFLKAIEAEAGALTGAMERADDAAASGGAYVQLVLPAAGAEGAVAFVFEAPADDVYYVFGSCLAPEPPAEHDSFLFSMDGQDFREWTVREAGPCAFSWAVLREPYQWVGGPPVRPYPRAFPLSKGPHTCVIKGAEPGTRLDRIAIANYPFPPE